MTVPGWYLVPGLLDDDGQPHLIRTLGTEKTDGHWKQYGSFRVDVEFPDRPVAVAALRKSLDEACAAARFYGTMGRTRIYVWDDEEGGWMTYTEAAAPETMPVGTETEEADDA